VAVVTGPNRRLRRSQLAQIIRNVIVETCDTYGEEDYGEGVYGDCSGAIVNNDSGSGTLALSGTRIESFTHSGSGAGTVPLSGARTEGQAHSGPPVPSVGRIPLSGSGTDEYLPPGIGVMITRPSLGAGV
jgi:hypothetical protein